MSKKKDFTTDDPVSDMENQDGKGQQENTAENGQQEQKTDKEAALRKELEELNDKYLRLYSEFDNFKRRSQKERIELFQTAGKDIIVALLPVLDDFERAQKSVQDAHDTEAIKEGINLVFNKLRNTLTQKGLKALESKGQDFDVDFHEAVTKIPAPSEDLKGKVVDELERGYTLNEKVIRFAKVVVGE